MEQSLAVKRLGELGHDTRMSIFRLLMQAGKNGLPVGEIQSRLDLKPATLSHHLHRLIGAGLVEQKRDGRVLYCFACLDAISEVVDFLGSECCTLEGLY